MADEITPYIPRNPGDLLSAGDWNAVQVDVKKDIANQIKKAIGGVDNVPHADDADKLEGKTLDEITKDIIRIVLEQLAQKAGTLRRIIKRLEPCKEKFIVHGLKACPLVDVYQLDYFLVVCARGETPEDESPTWVNFYLYHSTEKRIRIPSMDPAKSPPITIDIEPTDAQIGKIRFADLLSLYGISYTETTDLEELEASFWAAFFASPPNDEFDPYQYCHSPWFEKCCGERRSVKELKDRGDWDRIYFKWMPRKTVNLLSSTAKGAVGDTKLFQALSTSGTCNNNPNHPAQITAAPTQVQVVQYDFDTIGVRLIDTPVYPADQVDGFTDKDGNQMPKLPLDFQADLKVMLLLKA